MGSARPDRRQSDCRRLPAPDRIRLSAGIGRRGCRKRSHLCLVGQGAEDGEAAVVAVDGFAYLSYLVVDNGRYTMVDVEAVGTSSLFRARQGAVDEDGCLFGLGRFGKGRRRYIFRYRAANSARSSSCRRGVGG